MESPGIEVIAAAVLPVVAVLFVSGWRAGRIALDDRRIWQTGIIGVWLPLFLSISVSSIAAEAGIMLRYRPSLPGGFMWAINGGPDWWLGVMLTAVLLTLSSTVLASVVSIRWLLAEAKGGPNQRVALAAVFAVVSGVAASRWRAGGIYSEFLPPGALLWGKALLVCGVAAGISAVVKAAANRRAAKIA